ncbi:hypothetical protein BGW37DRAFT_271868 [Umbelopsis sp. PMI_123]|nr:hypothetical protein BGW37DRAFT_271868 [Umbelopsis sp. PMI_123]
MTLFLLILIFSVHLSINVWNRKRIFGPRYQKKMLKSNMIQIRTDSQGGRRSLKEFEDRCVQVSGSQFGYTIVQKRPWSCSQKHFEFQSGAIHWSTTLLNPVVKPYRNTNIFKSSLNKLH